MEVEEYMMLSQLRKASYAVRDVTSISAEDPCAESTHRTWAKSQTQTTSSEMGIGRFPPISSTLLEGKFGEMVHQHLNRTKENLKEYTLSREKIQATEASLEQLLFLTASFFEDME